MDVVIIINRAGSKGLSDLCVHGIMHLNLDRNPERWQIYQMCKDVRMVILCQPEVHADSCVGQWPARGA